MTLFDRMVSGWFERSSSSYNGFVQALSADDVRAMNVHINDVALETFGAFDTDCSPSRTEPERFYHGFVFEGKRVLVGWGRRRLSGDLVRRALSRMYGFGLGVVCDAC